MLSDPRLFNFAIMFLYALSAARWAYERKWADCIYWVAAFVLVCVVTFGYRHQ